MTPREITGLRAVALAAPGLPGELTFFRDVWGLRPAAEAGGAVYLRGSGPEHHLVALHEGPRRRIVSLDLAAESPAALDSLRARLAARGVATRGPAELSEPGGGVALEVNDPDGRRLRVIAGRAAHADAADHVDCPRKLSHAVLNSPQLEAVKDFYCDVLGFRVSDWSEDAMVFLRCSRDHHSVALNRAAHAAINHVAFEMSGIDGFMRGIGRMKRAGRPVNWGPGRHGPGNNPFAYFVVPGPFVFEYTCDLQQVDEATHQARVWQRVPHLSDLWGTAGPPTPEIRGFMAGEPDPGVRV